MDWGSLQKMKSQWRITVSLRGHIFRWGRGSGSSPSWDGKLGVNLPARAEHIPCGVGTKTFHEAYAVVLLYLGIIDILQEHNMSKKIEHEHKPMQFDSVFISAVDPAFYSEPFLQFIQKVFPPNAVVG